MEAAHVPWQPLGQILVDRGLLSDEELERALIQQARTGRRLGETLVELGYVSRTALTRALAEQYGLELATERGFGTGLRAQIERRQEPEADDAGPPPDEPAADDGDAYAVPELAHLEDQWALLAAANQELAALRRADEHRRAQVRRLLARVRLLRSSATPPAAPPVPAAHLVLVRLDGRYELLERDGAPPAPGEPLELPELDEALLVAAVGRSPLPHDDRPCVFVDEPHR